MDTGTFIDTWLNLVVFVYVGLLVWLYAGVEVVGESPDARDGESAGREGRDAP